MKLDVNRIPELIREGKLSEKDALNQLSVFVMQNPAIFGLQTYDEDFISEMMVKFFEKGDDLLRLYRPESGIFFNFFYCYIRTISITCLRNRAIFYTRENHNIAESIRNYDNNVLAYGEINYRELSEPKAPYSSKKISPEAFQLACRTKEVKFKPLENQQAIQYEEIKNIKSHLKKSNSSKAERIILILALKSSYYITEEQLQKVAALCNIEINLLKEAVVYLNQELMTKIERQTTYINRRNNAYYLKKKYEQQLLNFEYEAGDNSLYARKKLEKLHKNQTAHWNMLNELLNTGVVNIRPTNKAVAEVMGLCERQISYYLNHAKKLLFE